MIITQTERGYSLTQQNYQAEVIAEAKTYHLQVGYKGHQVLDVQAEGDIKAGMAAAEAVVLLLERYQMTCTQELDLMVKLTWHIHQAEYLISTLLKENPLDRIERSIRELRGNR